MEGKRELGADAKAAGRAAVDAGSSPNQPLLEALKQASDEAFEHAKTSGE